MLCVVRRKSNRIQQMQVRKPPDLHLRRVQIIDLLLRPRPRRKFRPVRPSHGGAAAHDSIQLWGNSKAVGPDQVLVHGGIQGRYRPYDRPFLIQFNQSTAWSKCLTVGLECPQQMPVRKTNKAVGEGVPGAVSELPHKTRLQWMAQIENEGSPCHEAICDQYTAVRELILGVMRHGASSTHGYAADDAGVARR